MSFLEFQSIAEPAGASPLEPKGKPGGGPPKPAPKAQNAAGSKATQNLLVHVPGEASGFYLLGIEAIAGQTGVPPAQAAVVGAMALVLLVLVRWLAGASKAVMATSFLAFVIWMAVFDNGFLALNGYAVPGKLGVVVAGFYSAVITALGTYGKLK
jgi:hypothetical protein